MYRNTYPATQLLITQLDVLDKNRITEVFNETKEHFGRVDVVVNNAGYGIEGEIEVTPDSEARKLFDVVFWGLVNVSKEVCGKLEDLHDHLLTRHRRL